MWYFAVFSLTVFYLREGNAKGNSCNNSHVALYKGRHQLITTLQTQNLLIHSSVQLLICLTYAFICDMYFLLSEHAFV